MKYNRINLNNNYLTDEDFRIFWDKEKERASAYREIETHIIDFNNPMARYYELKFPAIDGMPLYVRYICPSSTEPVPTVLMFHDYGRGIRGWHHMTRFIALGYAVVSIENRFSSIDISNGWRNAPEKLLATQLFSDAFVTAYVARSLKEVDQTRLITWGEGLGGGISIAVAAMIPGVIKCSALNPLPADFPAVYRKGVENGFYSGIRMHFRVKDPQHNEETAFFRALSYLDCSRFAKLISCPVLIGTGLMDSVSPEVSQNTIVSQISAEKRHLVYPKYEHERINFFEDELLKFIHKGIVI